MYFPTNWVLNFFFLSGGKKNQQNPFFQKKKTLGFSVKKRIRWLIFVEKPLDFPTNRMLNFFCLRREGEAKKQNHQNPVFSKKKKTTGFFSEKKRIK